MKNPVELLNFTTRRRLPVVLQNEVAECGLACIAMVAGFHGHKLDINTLRRRFPITLKGATLAQLMQIAHGLNFTTRPLRLDLAEMKELRTPCILHWELSHFVVLKAVGRNGIVIHDPARGRRDVGWDEVSKSFTGVALEMTPSQGFERKNEETHLKFSQLWSHIDGLGKGLALILLLSLALQVFGILSPLYMQMVVDEVVVSHDENLMLVLALGFLLLMLIQTGVSALRSLVILFLSNQLSIQIAANLFKHLLKLPLAFFERRHIGDIVSRFGSLEQVRQQMTTGIVEAVVDGIMMIGTLVMMLLYSPALTGVVVGALVLYCLFRWALYLPIKAATEEQIVATAKKDSNFMETVRAVQGIKLFGREAQREALWHNHFAESLNAGIRLGRLGVGYNTANQFIFGLENIIVIYLGAMAVIESSLTVGMLFAFVSYKTQFAQKAAALIDKWLQFRMVRLHLDRVADVALAEAESDGGEVGELAQSISGGIELRNLGFRYADTEPFVFKGVNAKIEPGQSVAIIGGSGCGKTTLMKVMLGLLSPSEGEILIDGMDVKRLGKRAFRQQVAAVMQDDALLSGSIADNITYFAESHDQDRIELCAKMAALHDDIGRMPMGYNTLIGDMGNSLSGGQRQRLLLARALYRQPRILFLDEATSHLDVQLESIVNHAVKSLNVTRIIIAHRPETIRSVDRILVMGNGQLQELTKEMIAAAQPAAAAAG
ncbi:MAG: peptidase domain-containing ABC transporter [Pseudomonadota bacterium]